MSLNQTFMRSVNTSLVVLLPILSLLLFGGDTLKDFAFALFIGVAIGAYSSIFIAAAGAHDASRRTRRSRRGGSVAARRGALAPGRLRRAEAAPRRAPRRARSGRRRGERAPPRAVRSVPAPSRSAENKKRPPAKRKRR